MSFAIHPGIGSGPTSIDAGPGPVVNFSEHSAVDPVSGRNAMFLRVVQIREDDGRVAPPLTFAAFIGETTHAKQFTVANYGPGSFETTLAQSADTVGVAPVPAVVA